MYTCTEFIRNLLFTLLYPKYYYYYKCLIKRLEVKFQNLKLSTYLAWSAVGQLLVGLMSRLGNSLKLVKEQTGGRLIFLLCFSLVFYSTILYYGQFLYVILESSLLKKCEVHKIDILTSLLHNIKNSAKKFFLKESQPKWNQKTKIYIYSS